MIDAPIHRWIEHRASGRRSAFVFEGTDVSYGRLAERIGAVAARLEDSGVGLGDRVVFCGLNRIELFETLFACSRIGAIFCPLNNRLTARELGDQIADCRPTILLATDGFAELLCDAVSLAAAGAGGFSATPVRDLDADPFLDSDSVPDPSPDSDPMPDDTPLLMVYTSGTTGTPKGAVLTQRSVVATCVNSIAHQDLGANDCIIAPLPTFHVGGLNIQTLPTLAVGGRVLLQRRFDPENVLDLIADFRPTQTLLVPAMLTAVASHPRFDTTDLSCLHGINTGSSVVPSEVMAPYFDRGVPVGQVYGTTETGPTSVVLRYDEAAAHIGSCGRPAAGTELRIVDDSGADVGPGEDGELWVRGPNVFSHYWDNPDATADAFVDGWYRTGDVGHRSEDGFVYISDRLRDMVITGGENVYPAELEAVLVEHPAVAEVAVIGRADERWGERPVAVVVLADAPGSEAGELDVEELRSWCDGKLARFKLPREAIVVDDLPRTALGKVQKHVLRARLEQR